MNYSAKAEVIQRAWRRRRRLKPRNDKCPITLEKLNNIRYVFRHIGSDGYVRGYCAEAFDKYICTTEKLRDPVTRDEINSIHLYQLHKCLGRRSRCYGQYQKSWHALFLPTVEKLIDAVEGKVMQEILKHEGEGWCVMYDGSTATSAFFANIVYLFILSRVKYRRRRNYFVKSGKTDVERTRLRHSMDVIHSLCSHSFDNSEIIFSYDKNTCIPAIRTFRPVKTLQMYNYRPVPMKLLDTHVRFRFEEEDSETDSDFWAEFEDEPSEVESDSSFSLTSSSSFSDESAELYASS